MRQDKGSEYLAAVGEAVGVLTEFDSAVGEEMADLVMGGGTSTYIRKLIVSGTKRQGLPKLMKDQVTLIHADIIRKLMKEELQSADGYDNVRAAIGTLEDRGLQERVALLKELNNLNRGEEVLIATQSIEQETETMTKKIHNTRAPALEARTYINDLCQGCGYINSTDVTDEDIFENIRIREEQVNQMGSIKAQPKILKANIADINDEIKALVSFVDARAEADAPEVEAAISIKGKK